MGESVVHGLISSSDCVGVDGVTVQMGLQAFNANGMPVSMSGFLTNSKKGEKTLRELKNLQWEMKDGCKNFASKRLRHVALVANEDL